MARFSSVAQLTIRNVQCKNTWEGQQLPWLQGGPPCRACYTFWEGRIDLKPIRLPIVPLQHRGWPGGAWLRGSDLGSCMAFLEAVEV
jgi:hypothetical protein